MSHLEIALLALVFVLTFAIVWLLKPRRRRGGMIDLTGASSLSDDDDCAAIVCDWSDARDITPDKKPLAPPLDPSIRSR